MGNTIARLAEQYPELPAAVILKTALLSFGVLFDPLMVEAAKSALPDFRPHTLPDGSRVAVPYLMTLESGSLVRLRCRQSSPFTMVRDGAAFLLRDGDEPLARFTFVGRPIWHGRLAADGTPLDRCGLTPLGDMLVLNLTPSCEYWTTPLPELSGKSHRCGFCGYGLPDERSRLLGQEQGNPLVPEAVLRHAGEAIRLGVAAGARHVYLTGGSMLEPNLEADRYLRIVRGVREAASGAFLAVGSQALLPNRLPEFKEAGADGVCFNLEVWDRSVWNRVCPGKAKYVSRQMWEQSLITAVDIFGEGNVFSAFVTGAEMVLDAAMTDPAAAFASNLEGIRWLLTRGIQPILSLFFPFSGTDMESAAGPDLHFMLRLFSAAAGVRRELGKPFPSNLACKGCLYMQVEGDF